ncbi:hypothetical protein Daus18300_005085 [Diaporthe australafricana]|uniref:F-box domain-containing protein n=1 Tax=Diaporthe australafricana TaxID=127596 RepID=A0ABR3X519_9PEZI
MAVDPDRLKKLPNELFDQLLTYLDLPSIRNLRLASKQHAAKCLSAAFFKYYREQETDLTPRSLLRLRQITSHHPLGGAVKRLTVVAVYHDPSCLLMRIRRLRDPLRRTDKPRIVEYHKELSNRMSQLYSIISTRAEQHGQFSDDIISSLSHVLKTLGSVDTLKLTARVIRAPFEKDNPEPSSSSQFVNWNCLWKDCHRLLRLVTSAMSKSAVEVATFSVFNDCFGKVQSRAFLDLNKDLNNLQFLSQSGSKIKTLKLTFSTATQIPETVDIISTSDGSMQHLRPVRIACSAEPARSSENFPGVAGFLNQTPNLRALELSMYNTLEGAPWVYSNLFGDVAKTVRLPELRRLTLRGIWATPSFVLLFLRNHPDLTRVDLREVHITGGTWEPILRHLESMPKLAELHLENLWSGSEHLLNLLPKNPVFDDGNRGSGCSYPIKNGALVHTRDVSVDELKEGLSFVRSRGSSRGKGSRFLMKWIQRRKKDYGPPKQPYVNSRALV